MAKMHSRARGKSGSRKPANNVKPKWLTYDAKTVEQLVVKLAKAGKPSAGIGLILRDAYGIPDVEKITGKKLGKILDGKELAPELPEDLSSMVKRTGLIKKHLEVHKKDMHSKLGLQRTESKIFRLMKYYKRTGRLPENWKYQ